MKHRDVQTGVDYAVKTGYGRTELGDEHGVTRTRVLDTAKDYKRQAPYGPGVKGIEKMRVGGAGDMLAEAMMEDGRVRGSVLVAPREILGLWSEHTDCRAKRREKRAADDRQRAERLAEAKALAARVGALTGSQVRVFDWSQNITLTMPQIAALVTAAEGQQGVQA